MELHSRLLNKTAPQAALRDPLFYEYLALVDALRYGRVRKCGMAQKELSADSGKRMRFEP